jgi:hypothetical protein
MRTSACMGNIPLEEVCQALADLTGLAV